MRYQPEAARAALYDRTIQPTQGLEEETTSSAPADVFEDGGWPGDPEADALWRARRPRRIFVRVLGWALVAASTLALGRMIEVSGAKDAIATWATMGQVQVADAAPASPAGPPRPIVGLRSK
jgi:hypothetical protein